MAVTILRSWPRLCNLNSSYDERSLHGTSSEKPSSLSMMQDYSSHYHYIGYNYYVTLARQNIRRQLTLFLEEKSSRERNHGQNQNASDRQHRLCHG